MVRNYEEMNKLEQIGLIELLKKDGWNHCTLSNPEDGTRRAMTKKIGDKEISVELSHFQADED